MNSSITFDQTGNPIFGRAARRLRRQLGVKPKPLPRITTPQTKATVEDAKAINHKLWEQKILECRECQCGCGESRFRGFVEMAPKRSFVYGPGVNEVLADGQWHRVHFVPSTFSPRRKEMRIFPTEVIQ